MLDVRHKIQDLAPPVVLLLQKQDILSVYFKYCFWRSSITELMPDTESFFLGLTSLVFFTTYNLPLTNFLLLTFLCLASNFLHLSQPASPPTPPLSPVATGKAARSSLLQNTCPEIGLSNIPDSRSSVRRRRDGLARLKG